MSSSSTWYWNDHKAVKLFGVIRTKPYEAVCLNLMINIDLWACAVTVITDILTYNTKLTSLFRITDDDTVLYQRCYCGSSSWTRRRAWSAFMKLQYWHKNYQTCTVCGRSDELQVGWLQPLSNDLYSAGVPVEWFTAWQSFLGLWPKFFYVWKLCESKQQQ